jgi:dimethylamine corrinoid protein
MSNSPIAEAFGKLDDVTVLKLVQEKIDCRIEPLEIVKGLQEGMDLFSRSCKEGDIFIADLILAGEIFQQSMKLLDPLLKTRHKSGTSVQIVLGTVKGDIHNLGKDIVGTLLQASGFTVYDLGINVAPAAFVSKLQETGAEILGLSGLITTSFEAMKDAVKAVEEAGLRDNVKVIIGGGIVSQMVKDYTGADAFSCDAIEGVAICKQLVADGKTGKGAGND